MEEIKNSKIKILRFIALSGILATIFYVSHVIGGRLVWKDYNPLIQPISDLTADSAISQNISSKFLIGYNIFNLIFCGTLLVIFKKILPINKIFYYGLSLKLFAELLSTIGYKIFPLADLSWGSSFQNTMHYIITAIIVICYIVLSILLTIGLFKVKKYPYMNKFLIIFSVVFILSGFLTVASAELLPAYLGLIERVNLYSLMVLNIVFSVWVRMLLKKLLYLN